MFPIQQNPTAKSIVTGLFFLTFLLLPVSVFSEEITGLVTHVRDADTIEVSNVPVRLNGISAPELDTTEGQGGKEFLQNLISQKQVVCTLNGEISHDRKIGVCYFKGLDLGITIVKAGFAADCPRYSNGRYKKYETEKVRHWRLPNYCKVW